MVFSDVVDIDLLWKKNIFFFLYVKFFSPSFFGFTCFVYVFWYVFLIGPKESCSVSGNDVCVVGNFMKLLFFLVMVMVIWATEIICS